MVEQVAAICPRDDRPWVLTATILASSMAFIDGSVTPIILPRVAEDLGASFAALQWVTNIYLLALSALIVVGGSLGDRLGRKRVFAFGVILFALASIACAAAMSAEALITARAVQGVGAAVMIPQSLAIITASYPKEERGGAIGFWASASALTTTLGPVVGGLLVDSLGWRSAFWVNVPLAAVCVAITLGRMPEIRQEAGVAGRVWRDLDWAGAAALVIGLGGVSWALIAAPEQGIGREVLILALIGAAALALTPWIERHARQPIAPPALMANRVFLAANLLTLLLYGGLAATMFLLPFDLMGGRGYGAAAVGVSMLPFGLLIGLLSRSSGRLADRYGPREPVTVGGVMFAAACLWLAFSDPEGGYWIAILPGVTLMGVAFAISIAPLTTAVMNAAPEGMSGAASGVNNAVSRGAGLLAVAGVGAIVSYAYSSAAPVWGVGAGEEAPAAFQEALAQGSAQGLIIEAVRVGYLACAVLGLMAAVSARALPAREVGSAD